MIEPVEIACANLEAGSPGLDKLDQRSGSTNVRSPVIEPVEIACAGLEAGSPGLGRLDQRSRSTNGRVPINHQKLEPHP